MILLEREAETWSVSLRREYNQAKVCVFFLKMKRIIACYVLMGMNKEGKEGRIGGESPLVTEAYEI